ncbi:MAG: zf-HC2 domain-containing protein [Mycobacterium leprae]
MNCDGVKGLLSAYLDGELSPGELLRVEQHLRHCHWCADEVDSLRQSVALVSSLDEVELPIGFHAALHDRLVALGPSVMMPVRHVATLPNRSRNNTRRWAIPAAAAAAAAALAIGLTSYPQVAAPGLEAPTGQFATPVVTPNNTAVAVNVDQPKSSETTPATGDKPQVTQPGTGTTTTQKSSAGPQDSQSNNVVPTGSNINPVGGAVVATGDPGKQSTTTPQAAPKIHFSVVLNAPVDSRAQWKALEAQYGGSEFEDTLTIQVPTAKFDEALKAIAAQLGVAPVEPVKEDLGSQIQIWTDAVNTNTALLDRFQKEYNIMSTAEQAAAKAQLDMYKQQVADAQRNLDSLNASLQRSTITVKLQPASR